MTLAHAARLVCHSVTIDEMSEKLNILPEELETILLRQNVDQDVIDAMKLARPKGVALQFKPRKTSVYTPFTKRVPFLRPFFTRCP